MITDKLVHLLILLNLIFFEGCSSGDFMKVNIYSNCVDDAHICGEINDDFEKKVTELINEGRKKISITSSGGYHDNATRIVNLLNKNKVIVSFKGLCLSACAQDFVLGIDRVVLEKDNIVAFHHSGSFMHLIAKEKFSKNEEYIKFTNMAKTDEYKFFNQLGIDKNALYVPASIIGYKCYTPRVTKTKRDMSVHLKTTHDWYVPNVSVLIKWRNRNGLTGGIKNSRDFLTRSEAFSDFLKSNNFAYHDTYRTKNLTSYVKGIQSC